MDTFATREMFFISGEQFGSVRSHAEHGETLPPYLGSGPSANDSRTGSGFYSVDDYRHMLRHAARLHVDVIPEIDMPGHAHAAIHAMRMRRNRSATDEAGRKYLLSDPLDTSEYVGINEQKDTVVNPCMNSTFTFLEHVISALVDLHKVSETHVFCFSDVQYTHNTHIHTHTHTHTYTHTHTSSPVLVTSSNDLDTFASISAFPHERGTSTMAAST